MFKMGKMLTSAAVHSVEILSLRLYMLWERDRPLKPYPQNCRSWGRGSLNRMFIH